MGEQCQFDNDRECAGLAAAAALEQRIQQLEQWQADSKTFHSKFYDWQRDQIARNAGLDVTLTTISSNIDKLVSWQEHEQQKPAKRLDSIVDRIIGLIVAAVVGYFLAKVGM